MTANRRPTSPSPIARNGRKHGKANTCALRNPFDRISAKPTNCLTVYPTQQQNRKPACTRKAEPFDCPTATPTNVVPDTCDPSQVLTTGGITNTSTHSPGQRGTVSNKQPLELVFRHTNPAAGEKAEAGKSPDTDTLSAAVGMETCTRTRNRVQRSITTATLESWKAGDKGNTRIPTTAATSTWSTKAVITSTRSIKAGSITRLEVPMGMKPGGTEERGTGYQRTADIRLPKSVLRKTSRKNRTQQACRPNNWRLRPAIYAI